MKFKFKWKVNTVKKLTEYISYITHSGDDVFIQNAAKSTEVVYKYFSIEKDTRLNITARGTGTLQVYLDNHLVGDMTFSNDAWDKKDISIDASYQHTQLKLIVKEGNLDILSVCFEK